MKFSTREDIEAPIAYVFDRVADFPAYERRALRQGAEVSCRTDGAAQVGTVWDVEFTLSRPPAPDCGGTDRAGTACRHGGDQHVRRAGSSDRS